VSQDQDASGLVTEGSNSSHAEVSLRHQAVTQSNAWLEAIEVQEEDKRRGRSAMMWERTMQLRLVGKQLQQRWRRPKFARGTGQAVIDGYDYEWRDVTAD
jgi:hypothetical protein